LVHALAAANERSNSSDFAVVSIRSFKGPDGYTDLRITVSSQPNTMTSFLVAHLACASTLGQDISEYVGLTNAPPLIAQGYSGDARRPGWGFGNGETQEFTVRAPYTSKPDTCSATIVGAVSPPSEVE